MLQKGENIVMYEVELIDTLWNVNEEEFKEYQEYKKN